VVKRLLKKYYAFYRLFYVIISIILLIPVVNYTSENKSEVIIHYPLFLDLIRYLLISGSLILFFKAFLFDYDLFTFFGIRQIKNIHQSTPEKGKIQKKGLLKFVRHPMYSALLILLWSSNTMRWTDIAVNTVLTIYIVIGSWLEEKKLIREFGNEYIQYQREVPMLIPFTKHKS
jgi:protein-S-isoprenylcysteine O-methyltransferase Ste14